MKRKKTIVFIQKISLAVEWFILVPSVFLGGSMVVIVISGVIARYALRNPMPWTEEASRILMIWTALLGISVVARHQEHLGIVFIVTKLPLFLQRLAKLVTDGAVLIFLYVLTIYGIQLAVEAKVQVSPAIGIPMCYPYLCVPICGLSTMIQLSLQMLIDLLSWERHESPFQK